MNPLYWLVKVLAWTIGRVFFSMQLRGVENLVPPGVGGTIIAANHQSFLDPPLIGCCYPGQIHFLARDTLFKGVIGKIIGAINAVPINQEGADLASLKTIIGVVKEGKRVLIFPEGSRTFDGKLQEAAAGVGMIVAKSNAIVQPVRIEGAFKALPRQQKNVFAFKRVPITVTIGEPIDFSHLGKIRSKEQYQKVADTIMERIGAL